MPASTGEGVDGTLVGAAGAAGAVAGACHLVRDVRLRRGCVVGGCVSGKGHQQRGNVLSLPLHDTVTNMSWDAYSYWNIHECLLGVQKDKRSHTPP